MGRSNFRWIAASASACLLAASLAGPMASAATIVRGPIGCTALAAGDAGFPVRVLQGDLRQLGLYHGRVTGQFTAATAAALAQLQRSHGLPATGVLNAATLDAIKAAMGITGPGPNCGGSTSGGTATGAGSGGSSGSPAASTGGSGASSGSTAHFVQGTGSPGISGGLRVGGKIDGLSIVRVVHLTATAYGATARDNYPYGAVDAFGVALRPGDVAVDPRVISLNTKMYVAGYSTPYLPRGGELAVARDTGGAIKGARIDMYINTTNESLINSFGIQRVTAYILR